MILWTVAHQAPLSVRFPRQEHWSGLPFLSWGELPNPGTKPMSPAWAGRCFTTGPSTRAFGWYREQWTRGVKCHYHHGTVVSRTKLGSFPFLKVFISGIGLLECPVSSFETHRLSTWLSCLLGPRSCLIQGWARDPSLANQNPSMGFLDLGLWELSVSFHWTSMRNNEVLR